MHYESVSFTNTTPSEVVALFVLMLVLVFIFLGSSPSRNDPTMPLFDRYHATQCQYLHRLPVGRKNRIAITLACTTDAPITTYAQLMR